MALTDNDMQEIAPAIEAYIDSRLEPNSDQEHITEKDLFHKIKKIRSNLSDSVVRNMIRESEPKVEITVDGRFQDRELDINRMKKILDSIL